jgi:hypothetical protein
MSEEAENQDLSGRAGLAASRAAQHGLHAERGGATLDAEGRFGCVGDPRATIEQFGEKDLAEVGRRAAADGSQDRRTQGALLGHSPGDVVGKIACEAAPVLVRRDSQLRGGP